MLMVVVLMPLLPLMPLLVVVVSMPLLSRMCCCWYLCWFVNATTSAGDGGANTGGYDGCVNAYADLLLLVLGPVLWLCWWWFWCFSW